MYRIKQKIYQTRQQSEHFTAKPAAEEISVFQYLFDGTAEMERAKQYSADAQKIEIDYPETAKLLRVLSDVYASQGSRDQLFSEIGVSAL